MKASWSFTFKGILFLSLLLLLGACSSANSNTANTASPDNSVKTDSNSKDTSTTVKGEAPLTKIYKDFNGKESEIPTTPQRVVSVAGSGATIDLLELGFEPSAYPYRYMENSSILKETREQLNKNAVDIGMPTNLEAVLGSNPDLIVFGYETQEGEYEQLEKIAPVAAFDESLAFQDRLRVIGDIVGKQKEAETLISDINKQTEDMWNKLYADGTIGKDETAAVVVYYWDKKMYLMKNFGVFDIINHPSGMKMSSEVAALASQSQSPYIEVSEESMLDMLVSDHLFLLYDHNADAQEGFKQLKQSGLYQKLPQVQNGKTHYIPLEYNDSDLVTVRKLIKDFPNLLGKDPF